MELTRRMSEMNTEKSQTEKENVILNQDLSQARTEIEKLKCSLDNINRQLDEVIYFSRTYYFVLISCFVLLKIPVKHFWISQFQKIDFIILQVLFQCKSLQY